MRILLDTNLWVSALLSERTRVRIERLLGNPFFEVLADAKLIAELEDVCSRPKIAKYLPPGRIAVFLQILQERLDFIVPVSQVRVCRDPDDDYLLAICMDGNADFLLTGDSDLLILSSFGQTRILTLTDFEKFLSGN